MNNIKTKNPELCDSFMDSFFELDQNQKLPFKLTMHLFNCKSCRTQVRLMTKATKLAKEPLAFNKNKLVSFMSDEKRKQISLLPWILIFIFMIAAMGIFTYYVGFDQFLSFFTYIVFAGVIIGYICLFVGTNLDFFIKQIKTAIS